MKILALHGYTQSGPGFQRKIKRLQSHLASVFPQAEFYFPTGPIPLKPSEKTHLLGTLTRQYDADGGSSSTEAVKKKLHDGPHPDDIDAFAWFALHDHRDPPLGFTQSLDALADVLRAEGPFDGILGFSQGALLAAMVASLLEGSARRRAFARAKELSADAFPFPESFKTLKHPPLKFGITYGAPMGTGKKYAAFYEKPRIQTPFIHFSGRSHTEVVSEMAHADREARIGFSRAVRVVHPGAHIVCTGAKYLDAVADFIKGLQCDFVPHETSVRQTLEHQQTLITGGRSPTKELCLTSTQSMSDESRHDLEQERPTRSVSKKPMSGTASLKCSLKVRLPPYIDNSLAEPLAISSTVEKIALCSLRARIGPPQSENPQREIPAWYKVFQSPTNITVV